MVRHHNPIDAQLNRLPRISDMLNALERKRLAARDLAPRLHQPRDLLPRMRAAVPDIVDPLGTRLVRHGHRIDPVLRQPLLKHWIAESQIRAEPVVERVIAVRDVVVPPAELPRVEREDASGEPRLVRARQQRDGQLVVVRHVELEEARALAVGGADVLDRLTAGRRQAVGQVELLGDFGDGQLAGGVVDLVDADGREADGRGDLVAEDFRLGVALVGVAQHARDDAVAVEGLAVREVGAGGAGVGGGVVPAAFGEAFFGAFFELAGVWRWGVRR